MIGSALLLLAAVSVSVAVLQWTSPDLGDLLTKNAAPLPRRVLSVKVVIGVALAVTLALGAFGLLRKQSSAVQLLHWGKLACPLAVAAFLPALFTRAPWKGLELRYLVALGAVGLVLEQLLALALAELPPPPVNALLAGLRVCRRSCWAQPSSTTRFASASTR